MDKGALQCRQRVHRGLPWAAGTPTQTPAPQHPPWNPDPEPRPASPAPCSGQKLGSNPGHRVTLAASRAAGLSFLVLATPRQEASQAEQEARLPGEPALRAGLPGARPGGSGGLRRALRDQPPPRPRLGSRPSSNPTRPPSQPRPLAQHTAPNLPRPASVPGPASTPRPAQPLLSPRPLFDPGPCRASAPRLYLPHFGSPPRPTARPQLAPCPARLHLGPVLALTAPAQPHAGPQLSPRPPLGPGPASPSAAAAQMLLGGRRWFRSHKMAALTAATSVPAAAGDAGERGGPARSPAHSPAAACTRRLWAGGGDGSADRRGAQGRLLSHQSACAHPSFPPAPSPPLPQPRQSTAAPARASQWSALGGALASVSQMQWLSPGWALRSWEGGAQVPAPLPSLSSGDCSDPCSSVRARGAGLKKQDPRSNKAGV